MDDLSEQHQLAGEISTAISSPVGFDQDVDEDELLRELQELQDEDLNDQMLKMPDTPSNNLHQNSGKSKLTNFITNLIAYIQDLISN